MYVTQQKYSMERLPDDFTVEGSSCEVYFELHVFCEYMESL